MKTILMEYDVDGKKVMLMRKALNYSIRCCNYKSKRHEDPLRTDYKDYAYTVAEGQKEPMKKIFYDECVYLTDLYGETV